MRLIISAIGLLKEGPESELVADYLKRLRGQAKQIGISQIDILEAKERNGGDDKKNLEAELLISQMPSDRKLIALDEHGRHITSRELANLIQKNEQLEDFIAKQSEAINACDQRLKQLDDKNIFYSDDQIGWFFKEVQKIQEALNEFTLN